MLSLRLAPGYVDFRPLFVDLTPRRTKRLTTKTPIPRDNHHKNKAIFYGGLSGAPFCRFSNKTNNKQHVNREYDPEPGTNHSETDALWRPFCFLKSINYPHHVYNCLLKTTGIASLFVGKQVGQLSLMDFSPISQPQACYGHN